MNPTPPSPPTTSISGRFTHLSTQKSCAHTLHPYVQDIVAQMSSLPGLKHVAITTNGLTLHRRLEELRTAGLNLVNISLDTLVPERFEMLTRRKGHDRQVGRPLAHRGK